MTAATTHHLHITPRAAALRISADPTLERPFHVSGKGAQPRVREHDGEVDFEYAIGGRLRALSRRGGELSVALKPAVGWAIELRGGVAGLRADLRGLEVAEIAISGGASDLELDLPQPRGELAVRVAGGLSQGTVRRPAGVPVEVEIDGGAADLRLDDDHLGAIGGAVRRQMRGEADGEGRVVVRIGGGASRLAIV